MVDIGGIFNRLAKKNNENEIEKNIKLFRKLEKNLFKKSKHIEKGKIIEENIKYIDHLKIALQFTTPKKLSHIKAEVKQ